MARAHAKALRIGIIQRGKIVEERLLRRREPVSIGSSPKNTFVIPQSDLPASFTLFRVQRGEFALVFDDAMDGRVHAVGGAADFGALAAAGAAKRQGDVHVLPLRDDQWGKALLGEVTVLFQFVRPPPEPPRASLPRAARGNRFRSMDPLFVLVLLTSLALHVSAYAGLAGTPVREEVTLEEIPDRFAKLLIPERRPDAPRAPEAPKREGPAAEKKAEEAPAEKPAGGDDRGDDGGGEGAAARKAARGAAIARAVQGKGLLRVLGALGPGARGGGAAAAVFGGESGAGGLGDVAAALSGAGSVAVAAEGAGLGGRRGGGGGAAPASIGELGTAGGGGARIALGAKAEVRVSASVAAEDAEIDSPELDQAKLGQFVRARMGALKACYESQLKRNPSLRGKIRIRFSVLETGAIADAVAVENGLGSPEVASCILATLRTWRTPFRPAGPVTVEYPFVFAAAN